MRLEDEQKQLRLKEAVREKLEGQRLAEKDIEDLLALQKAAVARSNKNYPKSLSIWALAISIACIIVIGLSLHLPKNFADQIALEVVKNHLKLKPLDVQSASIEGLRRYFTQLDFSPVNSHWLSETQTLAQARLLGGRYCSIKGVTAAQLRYQNIPASAESVDGNSLATLYQAAYEPQIHGSIPDIDKGETPVKVTVKGLEVSLWLEKDLLLVLVSEI